MMVLKLKNGTIIKGNITAACNKGVQCNKSLFDENDN